MKLNVFCAVCGRRGRHPLYTLQVTKDTTLGELLTARGWIHQQNGENFDIYCSEKCAK